jgi:hypothetical protein
MSDRIYTPDRWEVIKITNSKGVAHRRILGSWYGGFAGSDSWRASSGITKVIDDGDAWRVINDSGSVYVCGKTSRGMSSYTRSILSQMQEQATQDAGTIEIGEL